MPPYYVAGLVDGEECFALNFRRDRRYERKREPEYFYWKIGFFIVLRLQDESLLEQVRDTLDCGNISISGNQARYSVNRIDDLMEKIIPFFSEYHLYGKKHQDFLLWSEAAGILSRNRQLFTQKGQQGFQKMPWKPSDIERLLEIRKEMQNYKSKRPSWKWTDHPGEPK